MILYCDFNPRITREYRLDDLKNFGINVAENSRVYPSGFGIDCLVFTNHLGENAKVIGFFGGEKGSYIEEILRKSSLNFIPIKLSEDNTEEIILKTNLSKLIIRTQPPRITVENMEQFISEFSNEIPGINLVCLSGTDHTRLDPGTYEMLIKMCYTKGVKVAVTYNDLQSIGASKPYIFILNDKELGKYVNKKIKSEQDIISEAEKEIERGTGMVIVSTINASYIVSKDLKIKATFDGVREYVSKANQNLLLAGIGVAQDRNYDLETSIKFALACAISENFIKFKYISMADIKRLMNDIFIESI